MTPRKDVRQLHREELLRLLAGDLEVRKYVRDAAADPNAVRWRGELRALLEPWRRYCDEPQEAPGEDDANPDALD